MDFLVLFFVSLIALGTSSLRLIVFPLVALIVFPLVALIVFPLVASDRVSPGCTGAPFRGLVSRGSKLYK